ncbi:MAG: hypothetical protein QNK37_32035 [Acidobacteriota bacterium]|nr:hypothetical protein [Acidobacteriota bacterium]
MNFFGRLALFLLALTAFGGDAQSQRQKDIQQQLEALNAKLEAHGGLVAVNEKLTAFRKEIAAKVVSKKDERYVDVNGQEFQRGITSGGIYPVWPGEGEGSSYQAILEFHQKLQALGVDLIMVPVPSKFELYHHVFETELPEGIPASTARTAAMIKLLEAGVEVFDVLPVLEAARPDAKMDLYEVRGHHLSSYGAMLAADALAERLERYDLKSRDKSRFSHMERKSVERANSKQPMTAFEVTYDGEVYKHVNDGEVVVIGDSQAFAHFTASWASHLARAAGAPITDLSLSSGGSWASRRAAKLGKERLRQTKAVVWIVTSAAMGRNGWPVAEIPETIGASGLLSLGMYDEAFKLVEKHKDNIDALGLDEQYLNLAAYRMMSTSEYEEAGQAFKLIIAAYPESANAYDSYAEFLMRRDRNEEAIAMAEKALSMSPEPNVKDNSLKTLRRLGVDVSKWTGVAAFKLTEEQMDALLGLYQLSEDTEVSIIKKDGKLVGVLGDGQRFPMTPTSPMTFETGGPFVTFKKEGNDMILVAKMGNDERSGKRVSLETSAQ